jgi:hypothetical protein
MKTEPKPTRDKTQDEQIQQVIREEKRRGGKWSYTCQCEDYRGEG